MIHINPCDPRQSRPRASHAGAPAAPRWRGLRLLARVFVAVIGFGMTTTWAPAEAASAEPTPRVFASNNYGVTFSVPPVLFHCPYPSSWVGSDHGANLYLTKPSRCDPGGGEVADDSETPPLIQVFYAHSVAEYPQPDGTTRTPATNREMLAQSCDTHAQPSPAGLTLLGHKAAGCLTTKGSQMSLVIGSLYSEYPGEPSSQPDSSLILTLDTTQARYRHDLGLFRALAASLAICTIEGEPAHPPRARCPSGPWW
jgi:hypothetical protein